MSAAPVVEPAKTLAEGRKRATTALAALRKICEGTPKFPEQTYYGQAEQVDTERLFRQLQGAYRALDGHIGSAAFDPMLLNYFNTFDGLARQVIGHAKALSATNPVARRGNAKEGLAVFCGEARAALGNVVLSGTVSDRLMIHHVAYLNGSLREIMLMASLRFVPAVATSVETPEDADAEESSSLLVSA